MMRRFFLFCALLAVGCTSSLERRLDSVDRMMNEHPADALASLDSIGDIQIKSLRQRARYALLRSIALDKNYVDLKTDSVIAPAVRWYSRHGSPYEKARTFYYKGRIEYNSGDYPAASIDFIEAESLFPKFDDDYLKRLILISKVYTNNNTLFYEDNLSLLNRAKELLPARDSSDQRYQIELAIATYYNNMRQWEQADSVYTAIENAVDHDSSVYPLCLRNHARLLINSEIMDPERSYRLFQAALSKGAKLYPEDVLAYSVAIYHQGRKAESAELIDRIEAIGGYASQVANTRYRIAVLEGRLTEALGYQREAYARQDSVISSIWKKSVLKAQRDYYEEASARALERSRSLRILIWLLAALFISALIAGAAVISKRKAMQETEIARLSGILLQTETLLRQDEEEKEDYKAKYISKFKGQFVTLRKIVEDYMGTKGRSDQKDYVFRKVADMASLVSDDSEGNRQFEQQLNRELGNIMANFRNDFPNKDESTYRFVSYLIAGFDPPAISLLMGYSIGFIYKKKSRLVSEISRLQSAHKSQYLDFLR